MRRRSSIPRAELPANLFLPYPDDVLIAQVPFPTDRRLFLPISVVARRGVSVSQDWFIKGILIFWTLVRAKGLLTRRVDELRRPSSRQRANSGSHRSALPHRVSLPLPAEFILLAADSIVFGIHVYPMIGRSNGL